MRTQESGPNPLPRLSGSSVQAVSSGIETSSLVALGAVLARVRPSSPELLVRRVRRWGISVVWGV